MSKRNGWLRIVTCLCLVLALALTGVTPVQAKSKGYKFKYNGVSITIGSNAKTFLAKSKDYTATKSRSCITATGTDYTYTYEDFILTTYTKSSKKKTQYVNSITFKTNKVKTSEGIKIGSTLKQVKKKYKGGKLKYGVYTSKAKGGSKVVITISNDKVSGIMIVKK